MAIDTVDTTYFTCPECAGNRLKRAGSITAWRDRKPCRVQRYRCLDCGLLTTVPDIVALPTGDVNKLTHEGKYQLTCLRCGHQWESDNIHPTRCAKCKSPYWDRAKKEVDPFEESFSPKVN